ncbi:MAG TPA: efflux RND transporter permease subunit, partial [Gammaproteobacteria bacterium]|nr:efflux RND transporter permease subunit [Gammaproteobacteria bacterium]
MLAALVRFSLGQRLVIILLIMVILGGGWYALRKVPIDAFPDVSTTQVKIVIKAPGMTPTEVESRITALIEVEMLGIPNQVMLRSVSKYALADITVDFTDSTDIYWARQQVSERLSAIKDDLPGDIDGGLAPITTPLSEMFMFTVSGGGLTLKQHRDLLDWVIRPALRTIPGVADVNSLGGYVRTYEVIPDNASLNAHGVTYQELQQALMDNNRNAGAGRLEEGEESLLVRTEGSIDSLDDIASIVVKSHPYEPVHVRDVAEVMLGSLTRYGAVTHSGNSEIVQGLVLGLRGANAKQLIAGVKSKLQELQPQLPEGVKIDVFYDRSKLVDRAIHTVSRALFEAVVLVLILLVLLLGNLRAALTVAFILPTACLTTFILMYYFDISANLMSLG